jgi:hypothetical protein
LPQNPSDTAECFERLSFFKFVTELTELMTDSYELTAYSDLLSTYTLTGQPALSDFRLGLFKRLMRNRMRLDTVAFNFVLLCSCVFILSVRAMLRHIPRISRQLPAVFSRINYFCFQFAEIFIDLRRPTTRISHGSAPCVCTACRPN